MLKKQLNELKEALDATLSKNKEERDAKFLSVGWEYVPKIQASIAKQEEIRNQLDAYVQRREPAEEGFADSAAKGQEAAGARDRLIQGGGLRHRSEIGSFPRRFMYGHPVLDFW